MAVLFVAIHAMDTQAPYTHSDYKAEQQFPCSLKLLVLSSPLIQTNCVIDLIC